MPGYVPLNNVVFSSTADANYQGITGASGGSFRSFGSGVPEELFDGYVLNTNSAFRVSAWAQAASILIFASLGTWPMYDMSIGTEIIIFTYNGGGTVAISAYGGTLLPDNKNILLPGNLYRLVKVDDNEWFLSGNPSQFYEIPYYDCCDNVAGAFYQLEADGCTGSFVQPIVTYSEAYGRGLFNQSNVKVNGTAYNFSSGVSSTGGCNTISYIYVYTFYDIAGNTVSLYTNQSSLNINDNAVIVNYKWKTAATSYVYDCSTNNDANFTYYREYDMMYGAQSPVCMQNGYVISFTACV
jgi:hypothetical protein